MELFSICLLEATSGYPVRGISTLPLPFHTKLSWMPSHWFLWKKKKKKSALTAFHSYELVSFFILSWIWLPTCSGSILSVQVSVGGWLMRGENPADGGFSPSLSATRPSSPHLPLRPLETRPAPCNSRGHIFQQQFYEGIFLLLKM